MARSLAGWYREGMAFWKRTGKLVASRIVYLLREAP
jgi:hypothetical protein